MLSKIQGNSRVYLVFLPLPVIAATLPGIIGKIGSLLGSCNVNIASMQVGRKVIRGESLMVLGIDDPLPEKILNEIMKVDEISSTYIVNLPKFE